MKKTFTDEVKSTLAGILINRARVYHQQALHSVELAKKFDASQIEAYFKQHEVDEIVSVVDRAIAQTETLRLAETDLEKRVKLDALKTRLEQSKLALQEKQNG